MAKGNTDNRTHAQKRRAESQTAIRERFQGAEYVRQLENLAGEYDKVIGMTDTVLKKRASTADKNEILFLSAQQDVLKLRLDALKAKADLNFRRLKFVLPELRSIELTDGDGKNPFESLAAALRDAVMEGDIEDPIDE